MLWLCRFRENSIGRFQSEQDSDVIQWKGNWIDPYIYDAQGCETLMQIGVWYAWNIIVLTNNNRFKIGLTKYEK